MPSNGEAAEPWTDSLDFPLAATLFRVRGMLWTDALSRSNGHRRPNRSVKLSQVGPEARSLRLRVEARVMLDPPDEARAVSRLLPLPSLNHYPGVINDLAIAVEDGKVTIEAIEQYMLTSEY